MKSFARSIIIVLALGLVAPACYVYGEPATESTLYVGVRAAKRCHPSRYWNGRRCAKKRWHNYQRTHYRPHKLRHYP